ncbi:hypothetical protein DPMN_054678 [Dreissena polymorpha]|uniref:Uncharacterized protein n=1 Tax=Dreissena polymorpha TaxID=45954 RepID=A0A9D4CNJ6_DREPO|nr:hypothetical protein DPMN_054678 [Dreissena polymorpha]
MMNNSSESIVCLVEPCHDTTCAVLVDSYHAGLASNQGFATTCKNRLTTVGVLFENINAKVILKELPKCGYCRYVKYS